MTMTTLKELDSAIAKLEGKRHNASIGDVREIRRLIGSILAKLPEEERAALLKKLVRK